MDIQRRPDLAGEDLSSMIVAPDESASTRYGWLDVMGLTVGAADPMLFVFSVDMNDVDRIGKLVSHFHSPFPPWL